MIPSGGTSTVPLAGMRRSFPSIIQVIITRGVGFTTLQGPFSPRKQRVKALSYPAGPGEEGLSTPVAAPSTAPEEFVNLFPRSHKNDKDYTLVLERQVDDALFPALGTHTLGPNSLMPSKRLT